MFLNVPSDKWDNKWTASVRPITSQECKARVKVTSVRGNGGNASRYEGNEGNPGNVTLERGNAAQVFVTRDQ